MCKACRRIALTALRWVLAAALMAVSPAAAPAEPMADPGAAAGDWAGWLYLDRGGDAPLRLHIAGREGGAQATLDSPAGESYGLPIEKLEIALPQLSFERRNADDQLWRYEGEVAGDRFSGAAFLDGERLGRFDFHRSDRPLPTVDPDLYADAVGVYRLAPDRQLIVSSRFWGEILVFDTRTGSLATLFATSPGTFFTGPAVYVPAPVTAEVTLERGTDDQVVSLLWSQGTEPPQRAPRLSFHEEELTFANGDVSLAGTLIRLADAAGPLPAVVILGGSNWSERSALRRDADILAAMGMAVLIYDKRGQGESGGDPVAAFATTAGDAVAALEALRKRPDVLPGQVGFLGRSRGGWLAPLAAVAAGDHAAFALLLVAPAVSPAAQETTRRLNAMRADGFSAADVEEAARFLELLWCSARQGGPSAEYLERRQLMEERGWLDSLDAPAANEEESWRWMKLNMHYDPIPTLRRLRAPVLAIFGAEDDNVVPTLNLPPMKAALESAGNEDSTLLVMPDADHGLWRAANADRPLHMATGFAPGVWSTIQAWLVERFHLGGNPPAEGGGR